MVRKSNLDDPEYAAFAWARYRRLMGWMALFTLACVAVALTLLTLMNGWMSIHFYIATGAGIGASMLLTAALMGLVFLSSGTGHDEAVDNRIMDEDGNDLPPH